MPYRHNYKKSLRKMEKIKKTIGSESDETVRNNERDSAMRRLEEIEMNGNKQ